MHLHTTLFSCGTVCGSWGGEGLIFCRRGTAGLGFVCGCVRALAPRHVPLPACHAGRGGSRALWSCHWHQTPLLLVTLGNPVPLWGLGTGAVTRAQHERVASIFSRRGCGQAQTDSLMCSCLVRGMDALGVSVPCKQNPSASMYLDCVAWPGACASLQLTTEYISALKGSTSVLRQGTGPLPVVVMMHKTWRAGSWLDWARNNLGLCVQRKQHSFGRRHGTARTLCTVPRPRWSVARIRSSE